ncbi:lethal (3) malignant brain tumor isoform X3 [Rhodnius prolixus]|uniref:lethal (3) malignant brain tumor isoform X3 n=1 Tax=Rhodnius prolixus TaxID=13249 RepID=UPI003D18ACF6
MNEDNQRMAVDNSNIIVDSMGGSSISNNVTATGSHLEKRTLPLLYVQAPISKNLSSSDNSFNVPKVVPTPVTNNVSNGVNGGKAIQAFVGTLINSNRQQKVLLTPVKPGQEKQAGVARLLLQGQRPGQVSRVTATTTSPSGVTSTCSISPAVNVVLPTQAKQMCASYIVSPVSCSSNSTTTPTNTNTSSPIFSANRPTLSIRNAVLIDSSNSNTQTKPAQPNIIRQKIGPDGKIPLNSLLKPSGLSGTSLLSKVLATPPQLTKLPTAALTLQLRNDRKVEDQTVSDVVLIEDDDDDDNISSTTKTPGSSTPSLDSTTPKQNVVINGVKETSGLPNEIGQEMELGKYITSPSADRSRKRKGLLAINNEPPAKISKHQDKLKLLPGAEDFDPFKVVEWEPNGVGLLPGSSIKMAINELGMLTVADDTLTERGATPAIPILDDEGKSTPKKGSELDSILCCVCCSCYGLPAEFYNASYCSITCRDAVQAQEEAIVKRIEKEQEQSSDNDPKKKRLSIDQLKITPSTVTEISLVPSVTSSTEGKEEADTLEQEKKKSTIQLGEPETDNTEEERSIPGFMDGVLKQHSANEDEYNAAIIKAKKIVKKGKLLNSDTNLHKIIKSLPIANSAPSCEKQNPLAKSPKSDTKQSPSATPQPDENQKTSINKSPIRIDITKIRPVVPIKCKTSSCEVAQDLDCGTLTPNRSEKQFEILNSDTFPWATYLVETGSRPAWIKLFNNPFPAGVNLFQVGHKLEAIDPEHQSNICAVTVVKIKGYRLKLHFDCYSDTFDFWTNVDSPNIFPCGFCSRHGITLCPPQGHSKETFNWLSYNTIWMATAAPSTCFPSYAINSTTPNLFRVGMKLEAIDRKNTFLVCVATVAGVIENRILVHFDSWGDIYDYWVETSSPYIRPIGWSKENNHELTPPNGIKPSEFSWPDYLAETKSEAAPERAFTLRPHYEFQRGMKLEVVDKRAPHLLRVATIKDVLPYQIKIAFDGFPEQFGYWVDDDSPDIHPVGWAAKTGHPLEPPPSLNAPSPCPTPGCLGQGHMRSNALETHTSVEDCPYSIDHLNIEPLIPDRLTYINSSENKESNKAFADEVINLDNDDSAEDTDDIKKRRWKWLGVREGVRKRKDPTKVSESMNKKPLQKKIRRKKKKRKAYKINTESKDTSENDVKSENWENLEPFKSESNPMKWSAKQVVEFASTILGSLESSNANLENEDTSSSGSSEDNTEEIDRISNEDSSLESIVYNSTSKRVEMLAYPEENRTRSRLTTETNDDVVAKKSEINLRSRNKHKQRDHFDAYAEYLAGKLRLLDERSCAFVEKAFSDALFNAEMGRYKEGGCIATMSSFKKSSNVNQHRNLKTYNSAVTTTTSTTTYTSSLFNKWDTTVK